MSSRFSAFHVKWKNAVRVQTSPEHTRQLYFATERDRAGFELLPDFFERRGEDWSVRVTKEFEIGSALASRLDAMERAKFRMIFERHLVRVTKALFDAEYHESSDERALFLVFARVPPVRVCSAMARAKNVTLDMLAEEGEVKVDLVSALTTIFLIELNHILRVYIYFERANGAEHAGFEVVKECDDVIPFDYDAPQQNLQMSLPDKPKGGGVDLF